MSSNLLLCSDVGFENESRIKLGASSVPGHAANSVLYSGLMGGDSCHLKQNRKQRPDGRYNSIGDGLETSISNEAKGKIERVLGEVRNFSDVEKFVLYLKLPTGDTSSEDLRRTPTPYCKQANRVEQSLAYTWIKSHLEEDIEICLPKQEVYDEYRQYCENHSLVPLCNADFGKLMKTVFPNVKPRRLGQRGQSRYPLPILIYHT
uniref:RFX-type winged-helix domain-containing protein n=1 Tax=Magallana gigas TaxID=29159 RepID=A0A8W8MCJ6_MAGGI